MKVTNNIAILNDVGQPEIEIVTIIHNLDGQEAHDTARDLVAAATSALSGFHPETGAPL